MNKALEGKVFPIPQHVLEFLKQQPDNPDVDRNKNLLANGMTTYGQLKRILHDMKKMDKQAHPDIYNLYGGQPLEDWGKSILGQYRKTEKDNKESKKIADDISGDRKNAFNKTHTTSMSPKIGVNDVAKPSSSDFSAKSMKLTESINRIKKLMK